MTAQAPTDAELLTHCVKFMGSHKPNDPMYIVARALRSRLSPQTLQENTAHHAEATTRDPGGTGVGSQSLSPVGPHLGPEWLEEIQKRHDDDEAIPDDGWNCPGELDQRHRDRAILLAHIRKATDPRATEVEDATWDKMHEIICATYDRGVDPREMTNVVLDMLPSLRKATPGWRETVETFLKKYDEVEPAMTNAFAFQQNHIGPYAGPNWGKELEALRDLVSFPPSAEG